MKPQDETKRVRKWLLLAAKLAVAGIVIWFVADAVQQAIGDLDANQVSPAPGLLFASGITCLAAYAPMAWFWRQALAALGQPCAWGDVVPAYYLGHLGKYVPGKAMVVVLRTGSLRRAGGQAAPIAASVFMETLTMMAVGGAAASLLLLTTFGDAEQHWWTTPLAIGLALVAAAPTLPPVMSFILARTDSTKNGEDHSQRITWSLLASGWVAAMITWMGLAASLWLAIRSLDGDFPLDRETSLRCLLGVTLPVVAGFLSLVPGGLVVRDGLMFAILKPLASLSEPIALAATVLLRLIWVASEVLACVMLVLGRKLGVFGRDRSD